MIALRVTTIPRRRAVIPQTPVRRRRDAAIHSSIGELAQDLQSIAIVDRDSGVIVGRRDSDFSVIFYAKFRFRRC